MNIKFKKTINTKKNYAHPPIPHGYRKIKGRWSTGYTIRDKVGNYSVWVPAGSILDILDTNISAEHLAVKFKDGSSMIFDFTSKKAYTEYIKTDKYKSTLKYGGFYIGKYPISTNYTSMSDEKVLTGLYYSEYKQASKELSFEDTQAELTYETEHDLLLMWLQLAEILTVDELCKDSSSIGIYFNQSYYEEFGPFYTSESKERTVFGISDLCGNYWEILQGSTFIDNVRYASKVGGSWDELGNVYPAAKKVLVSTSFKKSPAYNICARHSLKLK